MNTCRCGASWTGTKLEHCVAPGCHNTFTCERAGDMHRTGKHHLSSGPDRRRCLTEAEMLDRGMVQNGKGQWMTKPGRPLEAARQSPRIDEQASGG